MKQQPRLCQHGFTIAELVVSSVVLISFTLAILGLYVAMVGSANSARLKSIGLGAATAQMEYLRSLPYDNLAIEGGTINSSATKLPATKEVTNGNYTFVITTAIQYVDDAYDGCLNYPAAQSYLCRNGPSKTGTPIDPNPRDINWPTLSLKRKKPTES